VQYSELQQKGFEIARQYAHLPLEERLSLLAKAFGVKSASVYIEPCRGKYRGQSDIMLKLEGGGSMGIGMRSSASAQKAGTISDCVNNALAKYNPEIVEEIKTRAAAALRVREAEDNEIAEKHGLKPYKFLNVELCTGNERDGYEGWYYVTLAVDNRIFGLVETHLAYDIERGEVSEHISRPNYFVAGGLGEFDADFVFNNVGFSSRDGEYKMILSNDARERAEKTLAEQPRTPKLTPHDRESKKGAIEETAAVDAAFPDPTVSIADMNEYGYIADEMFPLSQTKALELYDMHKAVYLLYPDDTEAMALDRDEIERYDGLFGIEKDDWERIRAANGREPESEPVEPGEADGRAFSHDDKSSDASTTVAELEADKVIPLADVVKATHSEQGRPSAQRSKPDFLAKIEANKQRVVSESQSAPQKNIDRKELS